MRELIRELFAKNGVELIGFCGYSGLLPLMPGRAALRVPPNAKSVAVCALPYYAGGFPGRNVSRYAVCDDYHKVADCILSGIAGELAGIFPGERFECFADISPVREVEAARLAGLGVVGRNGQLITRRYGAYVFIGEIVTTLELELSEPSPGECLNCGACLNACPTGALSGDTPFNPMLCRSGITQKKGELTEWERDQVRLGGMAWGCDLCLDACPMNIGVEETPLSGLKRNPVPLLTTENLDALLPHKAWGWRGRAVLLRNLEIIGATAPGRSPEPLQRK